jgi:hypothetical protein
MDGLEIVYEDSCSSWQELVVERCEHSNKRLVSQLHKKDVLHVFCSIQL